jgi:serine/threonine-protein kinase ATR
VACCLVAHTTKLTALQINQLAKDLNSTTIELFLPFWRSIGPDVVKDTFTCPQKIQHLADVLRLKGGVDELLVLTQTDTIPFLVITKRHDVLDRIRRARPGTDSIETLILEPRRNLACVLSRLLLESRGSEAAAASLLQEAAPNTRGKLRELVNIESVLTACEILKVAGDSGQSKPQKVSSVVR